METEETLKTKIEALKKENAEAGLAEIQKILTERGLEFKTVPEVIINGKPVEIGVFSK